MADLTPNDCLTLLATILTTELSPDANRVLYAYRTMPSLADVNLYVSYLGGKPGIATAGGRGSSYTFSIVMDVHHDGTETGRADAETAINDLEFELYTILVAAGRDKTQSWLGIDFPQDSTRPPTPESLGHTRLGELFLRIVLR